TNIEALDAARFNSRLNIEVVIVEHHKLLKCLEKYFTEETSFDFGGDDVDVDIISTDESNTPSDQDDQSSEEEAPIVKYITKLLIDAIRMG
ncbi:type IV-A pilus assembly ATPase PilB, partial [Acinetobacter nosocomialis]